MTTCQICGRAIKANTGLIAHHGYQRPYAYVQTASCFGARYRPYEAAHDAIDQYLALLEKWIVDANEKLVDYLASPPEIIKYQRLNAWHHPVGDEKILERPVDFDPALVHLHSRHPGSYVAIYATRLNEMRRTIVGLKSDQVDLTRRRAAWKEAA